MKLHLLLGLWASITLSTVHAGSWWFAAGATGPELEQASPAVELLETRVDIQIDGKSASVRYEERYRAANPAASTFALIPLPPGATAARAVMADKAPPQAWLELAEARKFYEQAASATGDATLLAWNDHPALLVGPLSNPETLIVTFSLPLDAAAGLQRVSTPMPARLCPYVSIRIAMESPLPIRSVLSPTHQLEVERTGPLQVKGSFTARELAAGPDFHLLFVTDQDPFGMRVLTHRAEGEEDGYFLLMANPSGDPQPREPQPKELIFVLDTSGSMRGEKIQQAQAALDYCLTRLNANDRFNIIAFGTEITSFRSTPVQRTDALIAEAQVFVDEILAHGRTNISGALAQALAGEADPQRPRMMLFLTDGTPTAGERRPDEILAAATTANQGGTRIFAIGVGHDVNAHLLDKLAMGSGGSTEYIGLDEPIDLKVAALYNRLSDPVLNNVTLDLGGLAVHSLYPRQMPTLFRGSDLIVVGRYREGGEQTIKLTGMAEGKEQSYSYTVHFPAEAKGDDAFIAPLWAVRKIGFLLEEMRLNGENEELIAEVVRLSRQFGIVTEYTAFMITANADMAEQEAISEARDNLLRANEQVSGKWAVQQARNDSNLKQRVAPSALYNTYVDRQGETRTVDNVRQIGGRTFYLRDGTWTDAREAGERQSREVKRFSDEYFELVRSHREFAEAQTLGETMSINVGNERIEVK